jgi:hypothetical protein
MLLSPLLVSLIYHLSLAHFVLQYVFSTCHCPRIPSRSHLPVFDPWVARANEYVKPLPISSSSSIGVPTGTGASCKRSLKGFGPTRNRLLTQYSASKRSADLPVARYQHSTNHLRSTDPNV